MMQQYVGLDIEDLQEVFRRNKVPCPDYGCVPCEMNSALEHHRNIMTGKNNRYTPDAAAARIALKEFIGRHKKCRACKILVGPGHLTIEITRYNGYCANCDERRLDRKAGRQVLALA